MAQSICVRQKFEDYQAFESALEHYQRAESVQFYKRDSRTVPKAKATDSTNPQFFTQILNFNFICRI